MKLKLNWNKWKLLENSNCGNCFHAHSWEHRQHTVHQVRGSEIWRFLKGQFVWYSPECTIQKHDLWKLKHFKMSIKPTENWFDWYSLECVQKEKTQMWKMGMVHSLGNMNILSKEYIWKRIGQRAVVTLWLWSMAYLWKTLHNLYVYNNLFYLNITVSVALLWISP